MEQLQMKVSAETKALFDRLLEESEDSTKGKFMDTLLERYQNPKLKNGIDPAEHQKVLDELTEILEEFRLCGQKYNQANNNVETLENTNKTNATRIVELEQKLIQYQSLLDESERSAPLPGAILVYPDPIVRHLLTVCVELETKRIKKPVGMEDILVSLFMYQVVEGPGDHLPRTWSKSELKTLQQQIKSADSEQVG